MALDLGRAKVLHKTTAALLLNSIGAQSDILDLLRLNKTELTILIL